MNVTKKPAIHGHRGARGLYPENSLVGIEAAIAMGCNAIEVDICVTRDVLLHDPVMAGYLVRDYNGDWIRDEVVVRQLNLHQIKNFDVGRIEPGSRYALLFPDQTSVDGTTIPTLGEAVTLLENTPHVSLNIELKSTPYDNAAMPGIDDYAALAATLIKDYDIPGRCIVQSFDWRLPTAVRQSIPELVLGFTTDNQPDGHPVSPVAGKPEPWTNFRDLAEFYDDLPAMIHSMGGNIWSSNFHDLDREKVQRAHELGLEVYAWTVNAENDMERMIDWQVDAIVTDYPDRLFDLTDR
jgi:glycerophosphoryl diester phosphodiesterase